MKQWPAVKLMRDQLVGKDSIWKDLIRIFNRTLILCDLTSRSTMWPARVMVLRWKYLTSTLKGLRKHLVAEHNTLRKERIEKGAYIFTLDDIPAGFPSKENAFVDGGDISRRCADSYEWSGIVKPEKFHLLSVPYTFFPRSTAQWDPANISLIENARLVQAVYPVRASYDFRIHVSHIYLIFVESSISVTSR